MHSRGRQRKREMTRTVEACAECTHKCILIHGKNKQPSPITSFFKVMIGDQFSKVLFLPPKFAGIASDLVGRKTLLVDSSGRRWEVALSSLNGSSTFQQGWHAFAIDHGLEVGDFVVFHYIIGSHFVVQIYNKSGCEKQVVENGSQRKRTKRTIAKAGPSYRIDKGSMSKQGSITSPIFSSDTEMTRSQCDGDGVKKLQMGVESISNCQNSNGRLLPVRKTDYAEEPYYMIDRDLAYKQGEERSSIFDLSSFEMRKNISGANESNRVPDGGSLRSGTETDFVKNQVTKEAANMVVPLGASEIDMIERNNDPDIGSCNGKTSMYILSTSAIMPMENGKANLDMPSKVLETCQISEERRDTHSSERGMEDKQEHVAEQCAKAEMTPDKGKEPEVMVGRNCQSSSLTLKDKDIIYKVVKTETSDSIGLSSPVAAVISCLVPAESQAFLELPTCLPSGPNTVRMTIDRKVVFLRDPLKRSWPVFYHEKPGLNLLASGWKGFSNGNSIQAGDECFFELEDDAEDIYEVHIVRKVMHVSLLNDAMEEDQALKFIKETLGEKLGLVCLDKPTP